MAKATTVTSVDIDPKVARNAHTIETALRGVYKPSDARRILYAIIGSATKDNAASAVKVASEINAATRGYTVEPSTGSLVSDIAPTFVLDGVTVAVGRVVCAAGNIGADALPALTEEYRAIGQHVVNHNSAVNDRSAEVKARSLR